MAISLIGMSGVGKSFWASKLVEQAKFKSYCIDSLIERELQSELKPLGFSGVNDVGRWMGQPWEKGFMERQLSYLLLERKITKDILIKVKDLPKQEHKNIVIDTSGSVIHCGRDIIDLLRSVTTVVHLETPSTVRDAMLAQYLREPKPVVWGHTFEQGEDEALESALRRSYPKLLSMREDLYRYASAITVPYSSFRTEITNVDKFLELINEV